MTKERKALKELGFEGFKSVRELMDSCSVIPNQMGVYVVLREKDDHPVILDKRPSCQNESDYPSYAKAELERNWVDGSHIVYIGKAGGLELKTNLNKRLRAYIQFGKGKKIKHGGGRSIWQLADAKDLVFCWRKLYKEEPREVERKMIADFCLEHDGKRPFANRQD
ncbi:MAG: hypothetical protein J5663_00915 [Bacteroidaceae bacterium]|nr:hypothetical protein [Bacteroidaceae bacterium]